MSTPENPTKRPYSDAFADQTIAAQVKRITELETHLAGWFVERDALKAQIEATVRERDEALSDTSRAERNRDMWKGQSERQAVELTTLRAHHGTIEQMRYALTSIIEYGKLCSGVDCERMAHMAATGLAGPHQT